MIKELNQENFAEVIKTKKLILVDFWASWCGPCRMLSPVIDSLSEEYSAQIDVGKVNVDEQGALAAQFGIVSIPTVILFKDGKEEKRIIGVHDADDYRDEIDKLL
ncbi:MAG: thioredoxin [Clostridia bacterium]|nr:thioredoxin [Clostridia bacterium]